MPRRRRKTDIGPGVFEIENLERIEDRYANNGHYWRATLVVEGDRYEVDTRFGSWMVVIRHKPASGRLNGDEDRKFVLPPVAADLQDAVHAEERRRNGSSGT